ncbi:hypothetical protein M426DRAFT_17219 [Hypoxylon sp. CI-4A]|nr:hypothetical protein M426DRAFT_17219 [Hypoxylon sp. CI-4A]
MDILKQSSPSSASSSPPRTNPGARTQQPTDTSEAESEEPESLSSSWRPDSDISSYQAILDPLADTGSKFTVRLHAFRFKKTDDLPSVLLGFVLLAQRVVDAKGNKEFLDTPVR